MNRYRQPARRGGGGGTEAPNAAAAAQAMAPPGPAHPPGRPGSCEPAGSAQEQVQRPRDAAVGLLAADLQAACALRQAAQGRGLSLPTTCRAPGGGQTCGRVPRICLGWRPQGSPAPPTAQKGRSRAPGKPRAPWIGGS